MLDDAVAAFLDAVGERQFDEPLLALLRAQGFTDVHLLHGAREFGKDVIARRDGLQWAWQAKAGDIGQSEWRALTGQLDELRTVNLGHGAFDVHMPRRPVLVTTGRLVGNAPELYRDYNDRARSRGEPELTLWTRDDLVGSLSGNPDAILRGSLDGQLLAQIGAVDSDDATMAGLEVFSRRWMTWEPERVAGLGVIEAALVCERLRAAERLDLACHLALCLVRGAWAARAGSSEATIAGEAAAGLFENYARVLADECDERLLRPEALVAYSGSSSWVTYPLRCVRIGELVALLALRVERVDADRARELRRWLVSFAEIQPGLARPLSDRYAVSMVPVALALAREAPDVARELIHRCAVWLADAYDDALGLAGVDAAPAEEIERVIGASFEAVDQERRRGSLLATVLLDVCAVLGFDELYADIHNDVRAVQAYPQVMRLASGPDEYSRTGGGNRLDPNVDFTEQPAGTDLVAPHHGDPAGAQLAAEGRWWDLLAISSALRDRHFVAGISAAAAGSSEPTNS